MQHLSFWVRRWVSLALFALTAPVLVVLSRGARRKLHAAFVTVSNPFWDRVIPLSDLIDDRLEVRIAPVKSLAHNCSEYELLALGSLAAQTRSRMLFEIGTFDGRSTRTLAANAPEDGLVITLNLPPDKGENEAGTVNVDTLLNLKVKSGYRFLETPESRKIRQVFGDSASFDFKPYEGQCDLVFIDGSHHEAYVRCDTETALRLVRPSGGLIVWHDAPLYEVVSYLQGRIREENWPLHLIQDTTLMIGYTQQGKFVRCRCPCRIHPPSEVAVDLRATIPFWRGSLRPAPFSSVILSLSKDQLPVLAKSSIHVLTTGG